MHYRDANGDMEEKERRKIKLGEFQILVKCSLNNLSYILRSDSHFSPLSCSFRNKGLTRLRILKSKAEKIQQ